MSRLFDKLKEVTHSKHSKEAEAKKVVVEPQPEKRTTTVVIEKKKSNILSACILILTCVLLLGIAFKALQILEAIERNNAGVLSTIDSSFEQNKRQITELKAQMASQIAGNDKDWKIKFKDLQESIDLKFSKMKLDLNRARVSADKVMIKNQELEAQIQQLKLRIEEEKNVVAQ